MRNWRLDGLISYNRSSRHYTTLERESNSWFKFDDGNKTKSSLLGRQFCNTIMMSYSEVKKNDPILEESKEVKLVRQIINAYGQEFYIPVLINKDITIVALYDTGATVTLISIKDFHKISQTNELILNNSGISAGTCANGSGIKSIGEITIEIDIGEQSFGILNAHVCDIEASILGTNIILGNHVKSVKLSNLNSSGGKLTWIFNNDKRLEVNVFSSPLSCNHRTYKIVAVDSITIPPRAKRVIPYKVIGLGIRIETMAEKSGIQINKGNLRVCLNDGRLGY